MQKFCTKMSKVMIFFDRHNIGKSHESTENEVSMVLVP